MLNEADLIVYLYQTTVLHFPEVTFLTTLLELSFIVKLDLAGKKKKKNTYAGAFPQRINNTHSLERLLIFY